MKLLSLILFIAPFSCSKFDYAIDFYKSHQPPKPTPTWQSIFVKLDSIHTPLSREMFESGYTRYSIPEDRTPSDSVYLYISANWGEINPKIQQVRQDINKLYAAKHFVDSAAFNEQFIDSMHAYIISRPGWDIGEEPLDKPDACYFNAKLRARNNAVDFQWNFISSMSVINHPDPAEFDYVVLTHQYYMQKYCGNIAGAQDRFDHCMGITHPQY